MPIVAEQFELVIGVDTHAATYALAAVAVNGGLLDEAVFPTTTGGRERAIAWMHARAAGRRLLVVVEGTGSYGAVLTEQLAAGGTPVVEAAAMPTAGRRGVAKTDALDAVRIARSVIGLDPVQLRWPRANGPRVAMRVLVVAREQMSTERTRAINALTALLRTIDLGVDARKALSISQIRGVARWRSRNEDATVGTCRREAVRLAHRVQALDGDLASNRAELDALVAEQAPELLELCGVGSVVAATVLTVWSHPGRVRSEAALASLAGTCPIPASSGNTVRHRLNRGGDRRLNRVITTIAIVRMGRDPATRTYVARRRAEGRTTKEIMRCLKRYITRQLYRVLTAAHPQLATP